MATRLPKIIRNKSESKMTANVAAKFQENIMLKLKMPGSIRRRYPILCGQCGNVLKSPSDFHDCGSNELVLALESDINWGIAERLAEQRNDTVCPVCMMAFTDSNEYLLSCSHIFHKHCLQSFERFVGHGNKACPICRTNNYHTKSCSIGTQSHLTKCAIKIQNITRRYRQRCVYFTLLKQYYDLGKGDISLRKRFYIKELMHHSGILARQLDQSATETDKVLRDLDSTMLDGCVLDEEFNKMLNSRAGTRSGYPGAYNLYAYDCHQLSLLNGDDEKWAVSLHQAQHRGNSKCAICLHNLPPTEKLSLYWNQNVSRTYSQHQLLEAEAAKICSSTGTSTFISECDVDCDNDATTSNQVARDINCSHQTVQKTPSVVLLSCSHLFHRNCIENLEAFARNLQTIHNFQNDSSSNSNDIESRITTASRNLSTAYFDHQQHIMNSDFHILAPPKQCPECRSNYYRRTLYTL